MARLTNIDSFFSPRSVAIVGASNKEGSIGNVIFKNFVETVFEGTVYPVTLSYDTVLDHTAYKSVRDLPELVDLAVIAIPAPAVNTVMRECVDIGVPACVVITGGFSEIGENEREEELKSIIRGSDTRVIGPNCVGVYDRRTRVDTIFLPEERMGRPNNGPISLVSQSGAFVAAMLDWASLNGIGMDKVVSFGNKIDVNYSDLIMFLAEDENVEVITIYMEGLSKGKMFMEATAAASLKTPVVIFKSGRSKAGAAAAASHTGSLAGSDAIYDAAFRQAGAIRVYSSEELFDVARIFQCKKAPAGTRVAIITDGGGSGVMATDALEDENLTLAPLDEATKSAMEEKFPPYCSVKNPIDLTGDADATRYDVALEEVLNDDNVDAVLLIMLFQVPTLGDEVVGHVISHSRRSDKPIIVVSSGGKYTKERVRELEEGGLVCYPTPERGVRALSALCHYHAYRRKKGKKG